MVVVEAGSGSAQAQLAGSATQMVAVKTEVLLVLVGAFRPQLLVDSLCSDETGLLLDYAEEQVPGHPRTQHFHLEILLLYWQVLEALAQLSAFW